MALAPLLDDALRELREGRGFVLIRGLPLLVRAGYARNELPFGVQGQIAKENRLTAGLGLPVAGEDATLDLSVQRANRTMSGSGFKESAWLLGIGIQIRPRN